MKVFRICKEKCANDLSGTGAKLVGGRWNSKGIPILYTSESRALAMAEVAVHLPYNLIPNDFVLVTIDIPENLKLEEVLVKNLSKKWNNFPINNSTQNIGNEFVKNNDALVLKVPSAVVAGDFNYLINSNHKDFDKIEIENIIPFIFDNRLFNK